jgi:hypothetical protein
MSRTSGWILALLLAVSNTAYAEDRDTLLINIGTERDQWQPVNPQMTPEDYRDISRNNLRLTGRALTTYSQERLTSLSMPEMGINLLGTAVGLATSTARFHVNKSKTMAVEFENLAKEKRALMFRVKLDW